MKKEEPDILEKVEDVAEKADKTIQKEWRPIFKKYPLTFTMMSVIGFVATVYGLEGVIDNIEFFHNNPFVVLIIGLLLLLLTGTLFKRLRNKEINH